MERSQSGATNDPNARDRNMILNRLNAKKVRGAKPTNFDDDVFPTMREIILNKFNRVVLRRGAGTARNFLDSVARIFLEDDDCFESDLVKALSAPSSSHHEQCKKVEMICMPLFTIPYNNERDSYFTRTYSINVSNFASEKDRIISTLHEMCNKMEGLCISYCESINTENLSQEVAEIINNLRSDIVAVQAKNNEMKADNDQMKGQIGQMKADNDQMRREFNQMRREFNQMKDQNAQMKADNTEMVKEIQKMGGENNRMKQLVTVYMGKTNEIGKGLEKITKAAAPESTLGASSSAEHAASREYGKNG